MNRIRVLDESVASRIAAGEVVNGPAAVVKELVENAIDAGATSISIEIVNGGRDSIRVTDNGCGIRSEDVHLAVEKHATSKIVSFKDLSDIRTLGFRGEALSSMAAVSRFTISTRVRDSISGIVLKVSGGKNSSVLPAGLPEGTTVRVEQLFFNVPARQKFLVNARNEAARVSNLLSRMILSRPGLSIKYINNGKVVYHSPGSGELMDAMMTVYGKDIVAQVRPVDYNTGDIAISGYISAPTVLSKTTNDITFFVNGRYIYSKMLHEALIAGYGERLLRSHYPTAVLNVELPYDQVDVNVHPNKTQVMFSSDAEVSAALKQAVEDALRENLPPELKLPRQSSADDATPPVQATMPDAVDTASVPAEDAAPPPVEAEDAPLPNAAPQTREEPSKQGLATEEPPAPEPPTVEDIPAMPQLNTAEQRYAAKTTAAQDSTGAVMQAMETDRFEQIMDDIIEQSRIQQPDEQVEIQDVRTLKNYKVVGQAFSTYLIIEQEDVLYVIDQHAAHERITFDAMKRSIDQGANVSQQLLTPYVKKFSQADYDLIADRVELLEHLGFEVEEFGPLTYKFSALPVQAEQSGMDTLTQNVLNELRNNPDDIMLVRDNIIQMACKHSIKAGHQLTEEQIAALMEEVKGIDSLPTCPHGRPIAIAITKVELQKGFLRSV